MLSAAERQELAENAMEQLARWHKLTTLIKIEMVSWYHGIAMPMEHWSNWHGKDELTSIIKIEMVSWYHGIAMEQLAR